MPTDDGYTDVLKGKKGSAVLTVHFDTHLNRQ